MPFLQLQFKHGMQMYLQLEHKSFDWSACRCPSSSFNSNMECRCICNSNTNPSTGVPVDALPPASIQTWNADVSATRTQILRLECLPMPFLQLQFKHGMQMYLQLEHKSFDWSACRCPS